MDTQEFSSCGRTELFGGQSKGAVTSKMTAGGRYVAWGVSLAKLTKCNLSRSEYFYKVPCGVLARDCKYFPTVKYFSKSSVFDFLSVTGTVNFLTFSSSSAPKGEADLKCV